ncbi:MAG: cysteine desulfurase family protein [Pseudomonadota bacterium]
MTGPSAHTRTYLDYNATAPLRSEARDAMLAVFEHVGNPSSVHVEGRWARRIVEEAREAVAELVGASPSEVVFTSGGTEANRLALEGSGRSHRIVSAIEHPSILTQATSTLPAERGGIVDLSPLDSLMGPAGEGSIVSLMLANNETGVLQPVPEMAEKVRTAGAYSHSDAVQAPGKISLNFKELDVDLLTISAHKLGGPTGVGALVVRDGLEMAPTVSGGGQERGRRAGTENLPGIAGFGAAAALARQKQPREAEHVASLRDRLEAGVRERSPDAEIHGAVSDRLPNTSCIGLPGTSAETLVMAFDLAGIAVSAGSACSSGKVTPSHVLTAMGLPEVDAASAIRVSLGWASSERDVEQFIKSWGDIVGRRGGV